MTRLYQHLRGYEFNGGKSKFRFWTNGDLRQEILGQGHVAPGHLTCVNRAENVDLLRSQRRTTDYQRQKCINLGLTDSVTTKPSQPKRKSQKKVAGEKINNNSSFASYLCESSKRWDAGSKNANWCNEIKMSKYATYLMPILKCLSTGRNWLFYC